MKTRRGEKLASNENSSDEDDQPEKKQARLDDDLTGSTSQKNAKSKTTTQSKASNVNEDVATAIVNQESISISEDVKKLFVTEDTVVVSPSTAPDAKPSGISAVNMDLGNDVGIQSTAFVAIDTNNAGSETSESAGDTLPRVAEAPAVPPAEPVGDTGTLTVVANDNTSTTSSEAAAQAFLQRLVSSPHVELPEKSSEVLEAERKQREEVDLANAWNAAFCWLKTAREHVQELCDEDGDADYLLSLDEKISRQGSSVKVMQEVESTILEAFDLQKKQDTLESDEIHGRLDEIVRKMKDVTDWSF